MFHMFNVWGVMVLSICLVNGIRYTSMQDTPAVPIGRSPRTDVLLKAENVVLEFGGSVVRLSGLYISFWEFNTLGLPGYILFGGSFHCIYIIINFCNYNYTWCEPWPFKQRRKRCTCLLVREGDCWISTWSHPQSYTLWGQNLLHLIFYCCKIVMIW